MAATSGGRPSDSEMMRRAAAGDASAWGILLMSHEATLLRIVEFRMDSRLRGRVDAADVTQEVFLQAAAHREDYFREPSVPLIVWLRGVVANKLLELHRHHLSTKMRAAGREASQKSGEEPDSTSTAIIEQLTAQIAGPRTAAAQAEVSARVQNALASMDSTDREVLAMRHFEQLTNGQAAIVLGIEERAAAKRYLRALERLKSILSEMPGGLAEFRP